MATDQPDKDGVLKKRCDNYHFYVPSWIGTILDTFASILVHCLVGNRDRILQLSSFFSNYLNFLS